MQAGSHLRGRASSDVSPGAAFDVRAASATLAVGDTIEHVTFGRGAVLRGSGDGKIDVRFADGVRTLVHAKR
jgi:hypothetical protein